MNKRLGGLAIAVAAVIGFTSPAAAGTPPTIVITPGYRNVITTEEATTFQFTGCEGTVDFVLDYFVNGVEVSQFIGSVPGSTGEFTFTWPTPGTFKIIVNCFPDEGPPSTDFVHIEVIPPPVATTAPPVPTTPAPVPTTAGPGPAPTTAAPVVPTTTPALPGATTTSVVGALAPATTRGATVSGAAALPATGQDNTALLAAAGALLAIGSTLVLVRRRSA